MEAMSYDTYHGVKYPGDGRAGGSLLQPEPGCNSARPQHCASTIQLSRDREGQDLAACYEVLQEEQSKGHRLAQDL